MAKALSLAILSTLLSTVCHASPISQSSKEARANPSHSTTSVTWYQSPLYFAGKSETMDTSCGFAVSSGTMKHEVCTKLYTLAMGVQQSPHKDCKFKMWTGSTTCEGSDKWTEIVVPKGNGTTCMDTGVLDGGKFTKASGIWSC